MRIHRPSCRARAATLIAGVIVVLLRAEPAAAIDPPAVARLVEPSLVRIVLEGPTGGASAGSGIVVSADGHIATNYHVVAPNLEADWQIFVIASGESDDRRHTATLVETYPGEDLAIIRVGGLGRPPATLSTAENINPAQGTTLFAFGYPGVATRLGGGTASSFTVGMSNRLFDGAWTEAGPRIRIIQHSATTNPGNSGGPIVNPCGHVVGINTERELAMIIGPGGIPILYDVIQGVYYASHVSVLVEKLTALEIPFASTPKVCRVLFGIASTNFELYAGIAAVAVVAFVLLIVFIVVRSRRRNVHILVLDGLLPWRHAGRAPRAWHLSYFDDDGRPVDLVVRRKDLRRHKDGLVIGHDPNCECPIHKNDVGGRHARLVPLGNELGIAAVDGTLGTSVDDRPVDPAGKPVPLRRGARVKLGNTLIDVR